MKTKNKKSKKLPWTTDLKEIENRMIKDGLINTPTIWPDDLKKPRYRNIKQDETTYKN